MEITRHRRQEMPILSYIFDEFGQSVAVGYTVNKLE